MATPEGEPLRVLVAGGSGFIGTELRRQLSDAGHTVLRLVRRPARTANEFSWSPASGLIDAGLLERTDAVINLSGASTGRLPWTQKYKLHIEQTRIDATLTLADAISKSSNPPATFISGSSAGYYGDRPDENLDENSARGHGFLSEVTEAWERTAQLASESARTVLIRTGMVLGRGGVLRPLSRFTRLGLGFRIGSGTDSWPWISLHDEASAIVHLLHSSLSGAVNLTGPTVATGDQITKALATALHRWRPWVIPEPLIRTILREPGRELLLTDEHVSPSRLLNDGFTFRDGTVESAINSAWA